MNVFHKLENEIISYADDNNYKESYALFKIGDVEELIDNYRCLQFKIDKAIERIKYEEMFDNDNHHLVDFKEELLDILKEKSK